MISLRGVSLPEKHMSTTHPLIRGIDDMARPTCDKIIETQLKFLVNLADAICIELDASTMVVRLRTTQSCGLSKLSKSNLAR